MTTTSSRSHDNQLTDYLTPEIKLLLKCLTSQISQDNKYQTDNLSEKEFDWSYFIEMSARHKILPLVYQNLASTNSNIVPSKIENYLHQFFQTNIQRNLHLTAELLKILNLFDNNQIKAVPIKGPILAQLAYSDFGLRTISDLDIIVRQQDFEKAQQLLIKHGYQANSLNHPQYYRQAQYCKSQSLVGIDLHYDFCPQNHFASVKSDYFWHNLETVTIAKKNVFIFSPEYMIIYLCLEGSKEHWRTLNRICDISNLICHQSINWNLLINSAKNLKKEKTVFLGLYLTHRILNTNLREDILENVNNQITIKLSKQKICNFLFRRKLHISSAIEWHLFNLQTLDYFGDKLKYLRQVIKVNFQVRSAKLQRILRASHS